MVAIARVRGRRLGKASAASRAAVVPIKSPKTVAHQLLAALQSYFSEHGDRADTQTIIAALNESGDFADVNYGRGLTPHYVAKSSNPTALEPRVHKRTEGKMPWGYSREDCNRFRNPIVRRIPQKRAFKT